MSEKTKTLSPAQIRFRRGGRAFLTSAAIMLGAFLLYDWSLASSINRDAVEPLWGIVFLAAAIASLATWKGGHRDGPDGVSLNGEVVAFVIQSAQIIDQLHKDVEALDQRVRDIEEVTKDL